MPFMRAGPSGGQIAHSAAHVSAASDPRQRLRAALQGQPYADGSQTVSAQRASARFANDGSNAPRSPRVREVYDNNRQRLDGVTADPRYDGALAAFETHWNKHKARYFAVATQVNLPAELIAALHWRESSGDFSTYLHQGDPLGRPAVNVPNDIPVFHKWEDAAVHALQLKRGLQAEMKLEQASKDAAAIATYAEHYNGLGYANMDRPSPYVFAGTNAYERGKYVADGRYSGSTRDTQPGVVAMLGRVSELSVSDTSGLPKATPTLRVGSSGAAVKELQRLLGLPANQQDGDFGPGTRQALMDYQRNRGLSPDGVVGPSTWQMLRGGGG